MNIFSYNLGHDGAIVLIKDGSLEFSIESEKDSGFRYSPLSASDVISVCVELPEIPDVICAGGWWPRDHHEYLYGSLCNAGYSGVDKQSLIIRDTHFCGQSTKFFSSSHERSHILASFGMSDLYSGTPFYALIWEGHFGSFYEVDSLLNIVHIGEVLSNPGNRFSLLYGLADPNFPNDGDHRSSDAGKLMALASFSQRSRMTAAEQNLLDFLLNSPYSKLSEYQDIDIAPYLNVGFEDCELRNFAGILSDAIFDRFFEYAKANLKRGMPLVIGGGCGLNCDWNTRWRESGLFSSVFVPPVANDSGSAIGTALDAQYCFTGNPKLNWTVYAGLEFDDSRPFDYSCYDIYDSELPLIAAMLADGLILAWVNGRYEIGPRALGNRSIIAAPFNDETRIRLNEIKQREQFRPIAPVCLMDDARTLFGCDQESPYMLHTYKATSKNLRAVTHVNDTARLQTVTEQSNRAMYELLNEFKLCTGYGVLCNTSLNFHGKGAINNIVDLDTFTRHHGLDGFVVNKKLYVLNQSELYKANLSRYR